MYSFYQNWESICSGKESLLGVPYPNASTVFKGQGGQRCAFKSLILIFSKSSGANMGCLTAPFPARPGATTFWKGTLALMETSHTLPGGQPRLQVPDFLTMPCFQDKKNKTVCWLSFSSEKRKRPVFPTTRLVFYFTFHSQKKQSVCLLRSDDQHLWRAHNFLHQLSLTQAMAKVEPFQHHNGGGKMYAYIG